MKRRTLSLSMGFVFVTAIAVGAEVQAATSLQLGDSGKSFASSEVLCRADPATGELLPLVAAGLFNPKKNTRASVFLNGTFVANLDAADPRARVWLADYDNTVVVAFNRKVADTYVFSAPAGMCTLPDTSGNTFSADGTLEYAASGKSYATVTPGCALNPNSGTTQPYINLFDDGDYLLNVSVNGVALIQLSPTHSQTPIFLSAGLNVISAANGYVSTDYYIRDAGDGICSVP